jgi:hypothetical protein
MTATSSTPIISIGVVVRNAAVFNFRRTEKNNMDLDSLLQTVDDLFALLAQRSIDYVLVGGIAMLQYVDGRNTEDIDLIVALNTLQNLPEIEIETQDMYFARGDFHGLQIDLLLTENQLFDVVRRKHVAVQPFAEREIPTATVEGLLLLKLYALPSLYRQGDFTRVSIYEGDVAALLQVYRPDIEPLYTELSEHVSETDMLEVKTIVGEIQQRIDRFGQRFQDLEEEDE